MFSGEYKTYASGNLVIYSLVYSQLLWLLRPKSIKTGITCEDILPRGTMLSLELSLNNCSSEEFLGCLDEFYSEARATRVVYGW